MRRPVARRGRAALGQIKTSEITIKSGDEQIKAFLAQPAGKGPFPAIVVIQEWWGLNDWIKQNAEHFAKQGFVALAPDLYRGKVATKRETAGALMKGMPNDRALRDLKAAVTALADMPKVNKNKIGSIGWCLGGGLSLQLAVADPQVHACAMCYGRVITNAEKLKTLKAPVLGIFGAKDMGIPPENVPRVREGAQGGRRHGGKDRHLSRRRPRLHAQPTETLANPAYNAADAKDAWTRIDAFFHKTLAK